MPNVRSQPDDTVDEDEDALWADASNSAFGTGGDDAPEDDSDDQDDADADDDESADQDDDQADEDEDDDAPVADVKAKDAPKEDTAAQLKRLQHSLSSEKGRRAADQREMQALRARLKEYEEAPKEDETALKRREKIEQAKQDYPDVVGPLVEQFETISKQTEDRQKRAQDADEREFERRTIAEQAVFEKEHPDGFDVIRADPNGFKAWLDDQPRALRDAFENNREAITDGLAAAHLIAQFKQSRQPDPAPSSNDRRRRQLDGARADRSSSGPRTTPQPRDGDEDALWAHATRKVFGKS